MSAGVAPNSYMLASQSLLEIGDNAHLSLLCKHKNDAQWSVGNFETFSQPIVQVFEKIERYWGVGGEQYAVLTLALSTV